MMTAGEVDKLLSIRAPDESVLSLYLEIPRDPAGLRELPAKVSDLIRAADGTSTRLAAQDEEIARQVVAARGREWLGHTLAIFVSGDLGLLEVVPLPTGCDERAVLAVRPHVRPLLATLQRHPDHWIAVIDKRHAWLLAVLEGSIATVASSVGDTVPSSSFGGWHGLQSYHLEQRVAELSRRHYRDAIAALDHAARHGGARPLVIGGHVEGINHVLAELPTEIRNAYAGCFAADPHTLTPARARELAAPVIARWAELRAEQAAHSVSDPSSGVRAALGLHACLAAVNDGEVALLLIPEHGVIPGYVCERCEVLSITGDECCDWGAASRAVPDLLEEMALRTLHDGGEVISVREPHFTPAAKLR